jgi:hypothetical protein
MTSGLALVASRAGLRYVDSPPQLSTPLQDEYDEGLTHVEPADAEYVCLEDSPVFENARASARVLAHVHKGRGIHVIGRADRFLQIKMRDGTVGFVPKEIASYKEPWIEVDN